MVKTTIITEEIEDEICEHIASGKSLLSLLDADKKGILPRYSTLMMWVVKGEAGDERYTRFANKYIEARNASGFAHADRIVDLSEKVLQDDTPAQNYKVAMDGLRWAAETMSPKRHLYRAAAQGGVTVKVEISKDDAALL